MTYLRSIEDHNVTLPTPTKNVFAWIRKVQSLAHLCRIVFARIELQGFALRTHNKNTYGFLRRSAQPFIPTLLQSIQRGIGQHHFPHRPLPVTHLKHHKPHEIIGKQHPATSLVCKIYITVYVVSCLQKIRRGCTLYLDRSFHHLALDNVVQCQRIFITLTEQSVRFHIHIHTHPHIFQNVFFPLYHDSCCWVILSR